MDSKNDAFDKIIEYERNLHEKNQKRIQVGIRFLLIIPICFLIVMFWTESNKVVFLALWIVSLFAIAIYLIGIEYMDYELQMKLREFGIRDEDEEIDGLIEDRMDMERIKRVANAFAESFEDKENDVPMLEDKSAEVEEKTVARRPRPRLEGETSEEKTRKPRPESTASEERPRRPRPESTDSEERPRRPRPESTDSEERPRRPRPEDTSKKKPEQNDKTKAMKDMVDAIGVEAAEEELMASIKRYVAEVNKSDQPIVVEPKKTAKDYAEMRRRRAKEKAQNEEE